MIFPTRFVRDNAANVRCDVFSQLEVDAVQNLRISLIYDWVIAVIELKRDSISEMLLLVGGQRVEEELRLVIMLLEFRSADALLDALSL
jgi:hypothetical protein